MEKTDLLPTSHSSIRHSSYSLPHNLVEASTST